MKVKDAPIGLFQLDDGELICISEYSSGNDKIGYTRDAYIVSSGENYWGGDDKTGKPIDVSQLKQFAREASRVIEFYTHEKVREGYSEGFLLQGHRFDISCAACNEKGEGKTAREFTSSDFYKQVMDQIGETE